ncbi:hypothetical protein PYCC9005_005293 [Savitreella phatthalungensis]
MLILLFASLLSGALATVCVDYRDPLNRTAGRAVDCTPGGHSLGDPADGLVRLGTVQRILATNNATVIVTPAANNTNNSAVASRISTLSSIFPSPSSTATSASVARASASAAPSASASASAPSTVLLSPVTAILSEPALPAPQANVNQTNMFVFDMVCPASLSALQCAQANATMQLAGQQISNVLLLTKPITVNVTLQGFCTTAGICSQGNDILSLAAAAPARTVALLDDDGTSRLYPQAVVKQFSDKLAYAPVFSQYDINLNVNSEASFYYGGVASGIKSTQTDFQYVVLHELMHGLGFTSAYEDYFTPNKPTTVTPNVLLTVSATVDFAGFIEYAFDRFIKLSNGIMATNIVQRLNDGFYAASDRVTFTSPDALATFFLQQRPLVALSDTLTANFTTAGTSKLVTNGPNNSTYLTLETSLNPFVAGSSVSHVSNTLYTSTADFLMRYETQRGVSFASYLTVAKQNGAQDVDVYGAFGPGLRIALANLGYRVRGGVPQPSQVLVSGTTAKPTSQTSPSGSVVSRASTTSCPSILFSSLTATVAICIYLTT